MTTVLVTGATGRVGRHVVTGLLAAGANVRALVRNPSTAALPPEVELVQGNIHDPLAVRRATGGGGPADAVFLLWPGFDSAGAAEIVAELPRRVVHLSSLNAPSGGVWGEIEELLQGTDATFLRPGGFAVNAQEWAAQFRTVDVIRVPSPEAGRSLIHERDIAAVAVLSLMDDHHIGAVYELTGPHVLTQTEQIHTIARALDRKVEVEALTDTEARQAMLNLGADPILADSSVRYWATLVDHPEPVTTTVARLTGRPALTFAEWAQEHADEFRAEA